MTTILQGARELASKMKSAIGAKLSNSPVHLPKEDAAFADIWSRCQPYTMTSFARGLAIFRAVRHVVENRTEGDFIECGVWRGGSCMIAMHSFLHFGQSDRRFVLFDTFEGMTEPANVDVDIGGTSAGELMEAQGKRPDGVWCIALFEEVIANILTTGYPINNVKLVKGDIRQTALGFAPERIAILHLDTDFYDSTKVELECFYAHLQMGGVLIVDDYGHWRGARKAVDEYFERERSEGRTTPMLQITDYTGRIAVR